jgi:Protein of unknown function (DUF3788)
VKNYLVIHIILKTKLVEQMSKGYFTDKKIKPDDSDILRILGTSKNNWDFLFKCLANELKIKGEYKFYGVNYGWAIRFNKSGRSIIALYPDEDSFTIQLILNGNQVDCALKESLQPEILNLIEQTEPIHEGKWIFIKVDEETDLKDIIKLVKIRQKIR